MIDTLISSKTRIKLLMKFFLNSSTVSYLRGLESEFGESSNAIRVELNRLEKAGMLKSEMNGNKKMFKANKKHPLFDEVHSILLKHIGIDTIVTNVIERLGDVNRVYLAGTFSRGLDGPVIDLIFVGDIDAAYLVKLIKKAEELVQRKIRYLVYTKEEFNELSVSDFEYEPLLLWNKKEGS
jgi:hypothetical protein